MKILIIRNFPSYMDVRNNTYNIQEVGLAKALVRKEHICDIVFWTDKKEETIVLPVDDVGKVHVFYRKGVTKFKNTVFNECEELFSRYDILQPCEYNQMQAWLLAKKYPNKTLVYHGPYYAEFNKRYNRMCKIFDAFFLKKYIKQETKFLVKSEMAKEFLVLKGILPKNVHVVGVGIDVQMLSVKNSVCEEKLYVQMQHDVDAMKILYVGRLEERRKISFIFDVFSKVKQEKENVKLYLIGMGDAKYVKKIFNYADKLGIKEDIVWQERMAQKYLSNVYRLADFFLLPTEYEIFGMVLLEAMHYETVVLTTENGGSSVLIKDGKNGFIIDNRKSLDWAHKIIEIYSDKPKMKMIQNNASKIIRENYTWDALADEFLEQYQKMIFDRKL